MAKKQLGQVDADLLRRVDEARGDVPRVRWVERALEAALDGTRVPAGPLPERGTPERLAVARAVVTGSPFKCPAAGCDFTAPSSKARCGAHGRTVVAA